MTPLYRDTVLGAGLLADILILRFEIRSTHFSILCIGEFFDLISMQSVQGL